MGTKKRYTIGVLIGGMHTNFPKEIISGISAAADELDINVNFFLGTQTEGFFQDILLEELPQNTYDYQFNTIYDYALLGGLDGLIVKFGMFGVDMEEMGAVSLACKFHSIPLIYISEQIDRPGCYSLISDNYHGICSVMEHLINQHHCERILFMSGTRGNIDAEERRRAYLDTMEKYALPVTAEMIGQGDYSEFIDKEVEWLLDHNDHPQAIVFANDDMAISGYKVCRKRGLTVGKDILITGFDDCEIASSMIPPLTTVTQNGAAMGRTAFYSMINLLEDREVVFQRNPVAFVPRGSCGCSQEEIPDGSPYKLFSELQRRNQTIAHMKQEFITFQRKSWYIPIIARELNGCMDNETEFCLQIMNKIKNLRTSSAYLFLLDPPLSYDGRQEWNCPETLRLASCYRNGQALSYPPDERPLVTKENSVAAITEDDRHHQFMTFLIFSGERQYGLLTCDIRLEDFPFFHMLSLQLGLSLQHLEISKLEREHRLAMKHDMEQIRRENRALDIKSRYDKLTGLLNLHGFTEQAENLQQIACGKNAFMIYADLDHLKEINDSWGHLEGNFALCAAAHILKDCLRDSDIVARIGGDEFLALVTSDWESFGTIFRERVAHACQQLNETSDKPYYVEISKGIAPFQLNEDTDLQEVIKEADRLLYLDKKNQRSSIRKV